MSDAYDWSSFDLYFYYDAPLSKVWESWATPRGLCSFFIERCDARDERGEPLPESAELVAGGEYRWTWRHQHELAGRIEAIEHERRLAFTFGPMRVDMEFVDTGAGIRVHLRQTGIGPTDADRVGGQLNCRSCWIFFMTNLVSVLKSGVDLRDADPARVSSMEVGYVPAD